MSNWTIATMYERLDEVLSDELDISIVDGTHNESGEKIKQGEFDFLDIREALDNALKKASFKRRRG